MSRDPLAGPPPSEDPKKRTHRGGHQDKYVKDIDIEPKPDSNRAPQIIRVKLMETGEGEEATKYLSVRRLYRRTDGTERVKATAGTIAFPSVMRSEELVRVLEAMAAAYGIDITIDQDFEDWLTGQDDS